jgi:hypothetical protein
VNFRSKKSVAGPRSITEQRSEDPLIVTLNTVVGKYRFSLAFTGDTNEWTSPSSSAQCHSRCSLSWCLKYWLTAPITV